MQVYNPFGSVLRLVAALVGLSSCTKSDDSPKSPQAPDSTAQVDTARPLASMTLLEATGPRLVEDSSNSEPKLELRDNEFVIHIPAAMARVLAGSLPGFTPVQRSAFDKRLVRWVADRRNREPPSILADSDAVFASALSVVVGDFNGDGRRDVAMDGVAGDSTARVFLLAAADSKASPQLIYLYPPQKFQDYGPSINYMTLVRPGKIGGFDPVEGSEPLDLRTDAVEVIVFEKASEVYFLERGIVKRFTTSD